MNHFDLTGFLGEGVELTAYVMLDFIGEPVFLHSGVGYQSWGSEDWVGVGGLGKLDAMKDALGTAPSRLRLTLNDPVAEYLGEALNERTWGRLAELYVGAWDSTGQVVTTTPNLILRGRMGPPEIYVGEQNQMSVVVEDIRALMGRVNGLRSTILDHQREAPGDSFFMWLPKMVDFKFVFNGGTYGSNLFPETPAPTPRPRPPNTIPDRDIR